MDTCSLQPPNSQSLSDAVIRDVLQRVWTPAHRTMRSVESTTVAHRDQQPKPPATAVLDTLERITRPIEISPGQQELPAIPARNTKTSLSGEEIMQLITADDTGNGTQSGYLANASEALDKERRRLNQIQYRKKQQAHIESVEEYVQTLQQEIQCLAQRQQNALLVMHGSVLFEWDPDIDRVVRMQSQSDMLTRMLSLLGNVVDVSRVFEGALLTPECRRFAVLECRVELCIAVAQAVESRDATFGRHIRDSTHTAASPFCFSTVLLSTAGRSR
ncbi:hypothetical protein GQ600_22542 [Phytophthora cactorum]|nr:hypothetical protein GQ600_22542 [Phytophthora cactorum]